MVLGELESRSGVENLVERIDKEVSDDFADVRKNPAIRTIPTQIRSGRAPLPRLRVFRAVLQPVSEQQVSQRLCLDP